MTDTYVRLMLFVHVSKIKSLFVASDISQTIMCVLKPTMCDRTTACRPNIIYNDVVKTDDKSLKL